MLSLLLLFCRVLTELCFWKKHGHDCKFEHCACVCVCAHHHADWDARLILWETIWNQAFSMSEIYNQFRGSGNDRKIKVAVEGIKLTTGFWRYRPKRLLFELASRKSRTLGVDQKLLIFWRPRCILFFWENLSSSSGQLTHCTSGCFHSLLAKLCHAVFLTA